MNNIKFVLAVVVVSACSTCESICFALPTHEQTLNKPSTLSNSENELDNDNEVDLKTPQDKTSLAPSVDKAHHQTGNQTHPLNQISVQINKESELVKKQYRTTRQAKTNPASTVNKEAQSLHKQMPRIKHRHKGLIKHTQGRIDDHIEINIINSTQADDKGFTTQAAASKKHTPYILQTKNNSNNIYYDKLQNKANQRSSLISASQRQLQYLLQVTKSKIARLNRQYPTRGNLSTLPGLKRFKQEEDMRLNASFYLRDDCTFPCPDAASLSPCWCDPCTLSINCSAVSSFRDLFTIFHSTHFPDPNFESFVLVAPMRTNKRTGTGFSTQPEDTHSETFLCNTFGNASFTSVRVEEMTGLKYVEAGAFMGSEGRLKELQFKWNSGLAYFPFSEISKMKVLEHLEVSGSSISVLPVLPSAPQLHYLFLSNNLLSTIPQMAFANLPNLMILDVGFNLLQRVGERSLHFSGVGAILYLDHNTIVDFHDRAFSGNLPVSCDVSYNSLHGLDQIVFQPILDYIITHQYDGYVDASNNPLECSQISWVLNDPAYTSFTSLPDIHCREP